MLTGEPLYSAPAECIRLLLLHCMEVQVQIWVDLKYTVRRWSREKAVESVSAVPLEGRLCGYFARDVCVCVCVCV